MYRSLPPVWVALLGAHTVGHVAGLNPAGSKASLSPFDDTPNQFDNKYALTRTSRHIPAHPRTSPHIPAYPRTATLHSPHISNISDAVLHLAWCVVRGAWCVVRGVSRVVRS